MLNVDGWKPQLWFKFVYEYNFWLNVMLEIKPIGFEDLRLIYRSFKSYKKPYCPNFEEFYLPIKKLKP